MLEVIFFLLIWVWDLFRQVGVRGHTADGGSVHTVEGPQGLAQAAAPCNTHPAPGHRQPPRLALTEHYQDKVLPAIKNKLLTSLNFPSLILLCVV